MSAKSTTPARRGQGRVLRAFLPYVRPHARPIAGGLLLAALVAAAEILRPWPLQLVFDQVLMPQKTSRGLPGIDLSHLPPAMAIGVAAAGIVLISLVGGFAAYGQTWLLSRTAQRVASRIRRDLFRQLVHLPLEFHHAHRSGDLLMRLSGDTVLLRELLVGMLVESGASVIMLAGTLAVMLWLEPRLTLISLAVVPVIALLGGWFGGRIRQAVRRSRAKEGALAGHAGESLQAIAVVQAFGAEGRACEWFERENRSSLRAGLKASRLEAVLTRGLDLLTATGTGVTLALGAWSVRQGDLTPGGLLVFLAYQRTLYRPIRQLARAVVRSAKSSACGERVLEVLEARPGLIESPDARTAPPLRGELRFDGVTVRYPRGDVALHDIQLTVPAGSLAVIHGESGAGKSTLLSLVPRLLDATEGRVLLDGHDVREFTLASLRSQIAMVFQESVLLGMTVRENIALGRPGATAAEIEEAAWRGGVLAFTERLPQGLDTVVGERGGQLSGGQRQRVALARAALRSTPVLLLDEPFAHLDPASREHALDALRAIAAGRTVVIVTHLEAPGLVPDLHVELRSGRIVTTVPRLAGAVS